MAREINKEIVIKHKKNAIKCIDRMFEYFINSSDGRNLKKADLIAYWLEEYCRYIENESRFDYSRVMHFKRGDIIQVNLGFNLGSEQGGLHYAVVLDNNNLQSSPVVTIIPLSSGTAEDAYNRDLYLGNELYEKVKARYDSLKTDIRNDLAERWKTIQVIKNLTAQSDNEIQVDSETLKLIKEIEVQTEKLEREEKRLDVYKKEVEKLKRGSIALMEQITTISKMRIYKPKNREDLLYKVHYSKVTMDKINEKLQDLFIYRG